MTKSTRAVASGSSELGTLRRTHGRYSSQPLAPHKSLGPLSCSEHDSPSLSCSPGHLLVEPVGTSCISYSLTFSSFQGFPETPDGVSSQPPYIGAFPVTASTRDHLQIWRQSRLPGSRAVWPVEALCQLIATQTRMGPICAYTWLLGFLREAPPPQKAGMLTAQTGVIHL